MKWAGRRKLINSRCFYIFLLPNIIRWNQAEFLMVWSGLEQYQTRKKVLLINFRKLSNKSFEMYYDEPLNKRKSNWNAFYTPYISHSLRIQKIFAVWYEDRAFQLLKFSMSQEVKKGPFAALTMESSKNFILTHLRKIMWFYLPATKDNLLGKVWGKFFFPMRNALDRSYRDLKYYISI